MNIQFNQWEINFIRERIPMRYTIAIQVVDAVEKGTARRIFRSDVVPTEVNVNVSKEDARELLGWITDRRVLSCYTDFEQHTAKLLADKLRQVQV